ncbi:MAG: FAD-binding protein [Candidatus Helarchaeota archaeon]
MVDWTTNFDGLITDDQALEEFRKIKYFPILKGNPEAIYKPKKKKDLLKIIKFAKKHSISLIPVSSTWDFHGSIITQNGGIIIDLRDLNYIEKVRECFDGMSADIGPGVTFKELNSHLENSDLRVLLPLRMPASSSVLSTYYGKNPLLEANKFGYHQDWMLLTYQLAIHKGHFVGMGSEGLETGGEPGDYPFSARSDLGRMLLGALGSYGIVSRVTCKLKFIPENYEFLFIESDDLIDLTLKLKEITGITDAAQTVLIGSPKLIASYLADSKQKYNLYKDKLSKWTCIVAIAGDDDFINVEKLDLNDEGVKYGVKFEEVGPISEMPDILKNEFRELNNVGISFDFNPHLRIEFYATINMLKKIRSEMNSFFKKNNIDEDNIGFLINSIELGRTFFCEYDIFYNESPEKITPDSLPNIGNFNLLDLYKRIYELIIDSGGIINLPRNTIVSDLIYQRPQLKNYYDMIRIIKYCLDPTNIMHPTILFNGKGGIDPKTFHIQKEVA